MRHTRNRQMTKIGEENFMGMKNIRISMIRKFDGEFNNRLDPTFKWHSEAVSSNFWSNWRKSCVSFDYKSSHPNAVGMATKYLPTKERN